MRKKTSPILKAKWCFTRDKTSSGLITCTYGVKKGSTKLNLKKFDINIHPKHSKINSLFILLHELGHVATGSITRGYEYGLGNFRVKTELQREAKCWQYSFRCVKGKYLGRMMRFAVPSFQTHCASVYRRIRDKRTGRARGIKLLAENYFAAKNYLLTYGANRRNHDESKDGLRPYTHRD